MKKLKHKRNVWLKLDEKDNALDYLEKCTFFIQQRGKIKWKWVIITLRQALYSCCILAIQGTNPDRVLKFNRRKNKQIDKLINFPEALRRIEDSTYMKQFVHSKIAFLSKDEKFDCNLLNSTLRNSFEHFTPKGWLIQLSGMPRIINNITRFINFLYFKSGNIFISSYKRRKIRRLVNIIKKNSADFR